MVLRGPVAQWVNGRGDAGIDRRTPHSSTRAAHAHVVKARSTTLAARPTQHAMELVPRSVLLGKRKRPIVGRALVNGAVEAAASGTKGIGGRGTAGAGADTDAVANHRDDRPRRDGAGRAKDCSFRAVNVVVSASRSDATAAEAQHDPADSDARYLACLVRMELAARSRSSNTASGRVKCTFGRPPHPLLLVLTALDFITQTTSSKTSSRR